MRKLAVALCLAVLSSVALAEENPLRFDVGACSLDALGTLQLQTLPMPKGWFWSKGAFDRTKTDVKLTASLSTTSCAVGAGDATMSSTKLGTFLTALLNSQAKEVGYYWNLVNDLSANQNHWWYFHGCDGAVAKVGCDQARDATFTVAAYGQDGLCRTYVNALGISTCAGDTISLTLASVQDPDQFIDPALCVATDCGIGACVSERVQKDGICDTTFPENLQLDPKSSAKNPKYYDVNAGARTACKTGAPCYCKSLLPASCQNDGRDCE